MKIVGSTSSNTPRASQLILPCYTCPHYPLNNGLTSATCSCDRAYNTTYGRWMQDTVGSINNWGNVNVTLPR